MNGSTNGGVVGFNPTNAIREIKELSAYWNRIGMAIDDSWSWITVYTFSGDENGTGGWYAPEAVEFEKNVLKPLVDNLKKECYNAYVTTFNVLSSAIKKWAQATGTMITIPNVNDNYAFGEYSMHAKAVNKNGNVSIDPEILSQIQNAYHRYRENMKDLSATMNAIVNNTYSFIGGDQTMALIARLKTLYEKINNDLNSAYRQVETDIKSSIEKYTSIAQQVAGSFNGAASTTTNVGSN